MCAVTVTSAFWDYQKNEMRELADYLLNVIDLNPFEPASPIMPSWPLLLLSLQAASVQEGLGEPAGLPWWLRQYRVSLQCKRPSFDPWVRKIPWRRACLPTPVFLPEKSHGLRILAGYSP